MFAHVTKSKPLTLLQSFAAASLRKVSVYTCTYPSLLVFVCRNIVDKIDKDGDGSVTAKELEDWIRHVSRR